MNSEYLTIFDKDEGVVKQLFNHLLFNAEFTQNKVFYLYYLPHDKNISIRNYCENLELARGRRFFMT